MPTKKVFWILAIQKLLSPYRIVAETGNEWRMKERLMTSRDASLFTQPSPLILVIVLCFVELGDLTITI